MQQRHSAPTSANIVIFSDSQPRLQKIGTLRNSAAIAASVGVKMAVFPAAIAKKSALHTIPPAIAASLIRQAFYPVYC